MSIRNVSNKHFTTRSPLKTINNPVMLKQDISNDSLFSLSFPILPTKVLAPDILRLNHRQNCSF